MKDANELRPRSALGQGRSADLELFRGRRLGLATEAAGHVDPQQMGAGGRGLTGIRLESGEGVRQLALRPIEQIDRHRPLGRDVGVRALRDHATGEQDRDRQQSRQQDAESESAQESRRAG